MSSATAVSHRNFTRKRPPISRVGSYDFNGQVDRGTMRVHMSSANKRTAHDDQNTLVLWIPPVGSNKNECFAVREREVLWTMRPEHNLGRCTDGRLRALSSLNYFRLKLEDHEKQHLIGALNANNNGVNDANLMDTLRKMIKGEAHDFNFTDDQLATTDRLLRHAVLRKIQYSGVCITGEEAASKLTLQGIAVTCGGLNTLQNTGEALHPGQRLIMDVPRVLPDNARHPAFPDRIGVPHGKVTPIIRAVEADDIVQRVLVDQTDIARTVALRMRGWTDDDVISGSHRVNDAFFAFPTIYGGLNAANLALRGRARGDTQRDHLDLMRRVNDAVTFTTTTYTGDQGLHSFATDRNRDVAWDNDPHSIVAGGAGRVANNFAFTVPPVGAGARGNPDTQVRPYTSHVPFMGSLFTVIFGNVRDVICANAGVAAAQAAAAAAAAGGAGPAVLPAADEWPAYYYIGGIPVINLQAMENIAINAIRMNGNIWVPSGNEDDGRGERYAHEMQHMVNAAADALNNDGYKLSKADPLQGAAARTDLQPRKIKYIEMQAVGNGNAATAMGAAATPLGIDAVGAINDATRFQPNIVVLDDDKSLPWATDTISQLVLEGAAVANRHSQVCIIFSSTFYAPVGVPDDDINISDNEMPFVGAWIATTTPPNDNRVYRSNYRSTRLQVKDHVLGANHVYYYHLTWSGLVHLVAHNILHRTADEVRILDFARARLIQPVQYSYTPRPAGAPAGSDQPTLVNAARYGAPGLGAYLNSVLGVNQPANETEYQRYLKQHSPIAALFKHVISATAEACLAHSQQIGRKTIGMALNAAPHGEAVDVCLTTSLT